MSTNFLTPGIVSTDFEVVNGISLETLAVGRLSTLKEFQDKYQQIFFTPALPYAWFYENHIDFDPLFSGLPEKYFRHIKKLSPLPLPIIDGFYGTQSHWNRTLWTIPADLWVPFCKQLAGKGYFDTKQKLVVLFSLGTCNGEDILAKLKGKQPEFITLAYIGIHTNLYSIVMSESLNTTTLSISKAPPDPRLKVFAEKFMKDDSSAANDLAIRPRERLKIETPEVCGVNDLTKAQRKRFVELSAYYRQVFDEKSADTE